MSAYTNGADPVAQILSKLPSAKPMGKRWMAQCPAHEDRKPSLQISRGDDGRALIKCFANCPLDNILSALSLTKSDLFVRDDRPAEPEAIFTYRDAKGQLSYQVVRYPDKDFKQRHRTADGRWVWNMQGVERIPYRLPEVLAARPDQLVFVVEGEKDVDRLALYRIAATTNSGGAGKWTEEHAAYLRDRHVVILPDNDRPGRDHARAVARSLQGVAASVAVVELPNLPPAGDISDWLDAGHDIHELDPLVQAAPDWVDTAEPEQGDIDENLNHLNTLTNKIVRMSDVEREEVDWLWQDFIARGKFGLWEGDPGVGKTYVLCAAGAAITRGFPLPGMEERTEPQNVLLLTMEDDLADTIRPRLDMLQADLTRFYACDEPVSIDDQGIAFLEAAMREIQPALVVIDPIMAYIPGNVDIYKPNQIRRITSPLKQLAQTHNCAIIGIRHLTKSQKDRAIYRGAGGMDFVGASRLVVLVGRDPDDDKKRAIVQTKTNLGGTGRSVGYVIEEGGFFWLGQTDLTADRILAAGSSSEDDKSAVSEAIDFLKECLTPYPRASLQIFKEAEQVGIKIPTLRVAKKQLGIVVSRHGKEGVRGGGIWLWALPDYLKREDEAA